MAPSTWLGRQWDDIRGNLKYDVIAWVVRRLLGVGVITALVGLWQKLRHGSLDWIVLGLLFLLSSTGLLLLRPRKKVSSRTEPHLGLGAAATGVVRDWVTVNDGPQVQLDYEWQDDRIDKNADRRDKPLYLSNSSDSDAMNVQLEPIEHLKWKARFDLVPTVSKRYAPVAVQPTIDHNGHSPKQIRNSFSVIFKGDTGADDITIPIVIMYSDIQGRDYKTEYVLKFDRTKGKATAVFKKWGRLVEAKKSTFLSRSQRFVLKILGREKS